MLKRLLKKYINEELDMKWMENNIVWLSFIVLSLPIGAYVIQFHGYDVSDNPENWAQFGDYIGGTYSVLITILAIYIARNLSQKDETQTKRQRIAEAFVKQISKIKKCTEQHQKIQSVNKFMRMIDENQLVLSSALQISLQELGDYYLDRIGGAPENIAFEESKKQELVQLYHG